MFYFFNFNLFNILYVYGYLLNNKMNKDIRMKKLIFVFVVFFVLGVVLIV